MMSNLDLQMVYPEYSPAAYSIKIGAERENPGDEVQTLNLSLKRFFTEALLVSLRHPAQAFSFFRTVRHQVKAAGLRQEWEKRGVHVPPIIIYSITNRCNLHCKGCYHQALRAFAKSELSDTEMNRVVKEAKELGVSFMVIAGGEPLVRKELLKITALHPEMVFFIFTNGLLIDGEVLKTLKRQKNVVPVISLEGFQQATDARRGQGVYEQLQAIVRKLHKNAIFFGTSLTVTRDNLQTVTDPEFIRGLWRQGCRLFFYVEYTAIREGTENWVVTESQRGGMPARVNTLRSRNRALFVSVPGDEEQFGGCLAAGKGFIHISAEGNVEPCPFAPYSDANLQQVSLRVALQSKFLKALRENKEQMTEAAGGCALWEKREWVKTLLPGPAATNVEDNVVEEKKADVPAPVG